MKKEQWQAVYTPNNEEMLERRVRQTLSGLQEDAPARRISGRRMMLIAAALVLMLAAAVAAAAGWMRSAKYDAKRLAQEALYEKYGFTREMDSFFICTVEENDGETVVTYHANEDVGDYAWKLGDYIVTIRNGQAEASWSNDGEAVGDDFSSDVWDTAMLARGMELVKAGQQWYEITGTPLAWDEQTEEAFVPEKLKGLEQAQKADEDNEDVRAAKRALSEKYGLTEENYALFDVWMEETNEGKRVSFVPNILPEKDAYRLDGAGNYASCSERMGRYVVMLGKEGAVVSWTHDGKPLPDVTESTWGRAEIYDAKSLTYLAKLLDDLDKLYVRYPENLWTRTPEGDAAIDARLIEAGFSAKQYNHVLPTEGMLTEEDALALGRQVLENDGGLTPEMLDGEQSEIYAVCTLEEGQVVWSVWHHSAMGISVVKISAENGEILDVIVDYGMAGNG